MFLGTPVLHGEELITCYNTLPGPNYNRSSRGNDTTFPMKPSDLPYPAEVPLSSIEVCADGKSCIDHITESASVTKNLIMSYEHKLTTLNVKRNYYKAQLGVRERIEKHNRHIVEATYD